MKRLALLLVIAGTSLHAQELVIGASLPETTIVDDSGRVRSTAEWKGTPTILAPIYVRCPLACPMIARGLKRGAAESSASASTYRVVLFSFDPRDTPADLRNFREQHQIPLAWTVATAAHKGDERRMLDALGYRYGEAGGHYTHPNAVIALTPDLKTAKVLFGTTYDIDAALDVARGGHDWIGQYGGWMLGVLLLVFLLSVVYLVTLVSGRHAASGVVADRL